MTDVKKLAASLIAKYDKDTNGLDAGQWKQVFEDAQFKAAVNCEGLNAQGLFKQYQGNNAFLEPNELESLINAHLK